MNFHYIPIDSAIADRFRQTGVDDGGNHAALMIFILFSGVSGFQHRRESANPLGDFLLRERRVP